MNLHSGGETGQGKVRTKMIRGAGMDFQRGMWAEAWVQSLVARQYVALAVFGVLAIELLNEGFGISESGGSFASMFLWSCLAFVVHAQILLPSDSIADAIVLRVFGFAMRSFGIFVLMLIASALLTIIFTLVFGTEQSRVLFVYALVAFVILGLPVFVWLGTILPAFVAGRARGVRAAVKRGKTQFGWIAGRLIIGPGVLLVLSLALGLLLLIPVDYNGEFWNEQGVFQPLVVFALFICFTVQAFATALTAVILSRAFLRAEGMPDAAAA
ncbi:MAG: hypothetical protein WBN88_22555 [Anderseniella sp.]